MERLAADGLRLLYDAGCRLLNVTLASQLPARAAIDDNQDVGEGVEIDLPTTLAAKGEVAFELDHCGIWARGYHDPEGFVVTAARRCATSRPRV